MDIAILDPILLGYLDCRTLARVACTCKALCANALHAIERKTKRVGETIVRVRGFAEATRRAFLRCVSQQRLHDWWFYGDDDSMGALRSLESEAIRHLSAEQTKLVAHANLFFVVLLHEALSSMPEAAACAAFLTERGQTPSERKRPAAMGRRDLRREGEREERAEVVWARLCRLLEEHGLSARYDITGARGPCLPSVSELLVARALQEDPRTAPALRAARRSVYEKVVACVIEFETLREDYLRQKKELIGILDREIGLGPPFLWQYRKANFRRPSGFCSLPEGLKSD